MKSKKEINHSYYMRKVKPFRQKKHPVGYHSFKCPICSKRSFMKNLKYPQSFSVDYVLFTGREGIKWFKGKFDPDQKKLIVQLIKVKLIEDNIQRFIPQIDDDISDDNNYINSIKQILIDKSPKLL